MAHINCDNIYNEKKQNRFLVSYQINCFLLRADVLNVCSFIYLIRTSIAKKVVAIATKKQKNTKNIDFLVKLGYNN